MATSKKEYEAIDAKPIVLYGLTDASSTRAIPVLVDSNGRLKVSAPAGFGLPSGSTGQIQFNNSGVFDGIPASVVTSAGFSAGAVQLAGLGIGTTPGSFLGTYRLVEKGDVKFFDVSSNTVFDSGGGGIYIQAVTGDALMTSAVGSSVISNSLFGNYVTADLNGNCTVRAYGDTGGMYATYDYTYLGHYAAGNPMIIDVNGTVAIQSAGSPSGGQILMVGPDTGTGATVSYNSNGNSMFVDYYTGYPNTQVGFRLIQDVTGLEMGVCGGDGDYHTDSLAGDGIFKGNLSASNYMRFGIDSSDSAFVICPNKTVLVGYGSAGTYGLLQVNGDQYLSGGLQAIGNSAIGRAPLSGARLTLEFGTTSLAPLNLQSGSFKTSAYPGDIERNADDLTLTISTGSARKYILMNDGTKLTSGLLPVASTNGRLIDSKIKITTGRSTAQAAAVASVAAVTAPAADGTFLVSANVLVTTSTLHNFTVTCAYTDESNTARTLTLSFSTLAGVFGTAIANAGGAVPYEGVPMHIRVKASTAITIATTGTFTTVTYNVEGLIRQIA